jgi:hypothetical protein
MMATLDVAFRSGVLLLNGDPQPVKLHCPGRKSHRTGWTELPECRLRFQVVHKIISLRFHFRACDNDHHSLSALASAEVNFWFTCWRKRLVARADGCGKRRRMTFLATWESAYI